MSIVGFNFTKLNVEVKKRTAKGKVNVNSNVSLKNVEKKDFNVASDKQGALKFDFLFTVKYEPDIGTMELEGDVLYLGEKEKVEKSLESWNNKKEIPSEVMEEVMNTALTKSNIQALLLSQQVNLPAPIRLPKVKASQNKQEEQKEQK